MKTKFSRWIPFLLFGLSFALLFVGRTIQFTGDSLWYARSALDGVDLFHPHHLLYNATLHWIYNLVHSWIPAIDILLVAQLINILCASLVVVLVYRIVSKFTDGWIPIWIALCLLVCNGFWKYATQVEVYLPAILFSLLTIYTVWNVNKPTWLRLTAGALFLTLAILFHQTNVLLLIPLLFLFWPLSKMHLLQWITVVGSAGIATLGIYILVMVQANYQISGKGFIQFSLNYAVGNQEGWGTFRNMLPQGWYDMLGSQGAMIIAYVYSRVVFYWVLITGGIGSIIVYQIRLLRQGKWPDRTASLVRCLLAWIFTFYLFFLWWLPKEGEFFIATLVPLLILMGLAIHTWRWKGSRYILPLFFVVLMAFNTRSFYQVHTKKSKFGLRAEQLDSTATDSTLIITDFFTEQYLRFFYQQEVLGTGVLFRYVYEESSNKGLERLASKPAILILVRALSPSFEINGYSGNSHPEAWLTAFEQLFVKNKTVELLKIGPEYYWQFRHSPEASAEIADMMHTLDQKLVAAGQSARYVDWWREYIRPEANVRLPSSH